MSWDNLQAEISAEFDAGQESADTWSLSSFENTNVFRRRCTSGEKTRGIAAPLCNCAHRHLQHTARGCNAIVVKKGHGREPCECRSFVWVSQ